jgi:hypothetical protein
MENRNDLSNKKINLFEDNNRYNSSNYYNNNNPGNY